MEIVIIVYAPSLLVYYMTIICVQDENIYAY